MSKSKLILLSVLIALALNFVFFIALGIYSNIDKGGRGEIYGDIASGPFGCDNFQGDLFRCSAMEFFIIEPVVTMIFVAVFGLGLNIIIPSVLAFLLLRKRFSNRS